MAFYSLEPWGYFTEYHRSGMIAATVYNVNRGKNKALSAKDFMPKDMAEKQNVIAQIHNLKAHIGDGNS